MNIKSRIKKISDAMRKQAEETANEPIMTLEQWKRHTDGEDIRAEIPPHRLAEFDEHERIGNERLRQVAETYFSHCPELLESDYEH